MEERKANNMLRLEILHQDEIIQTIPLVSYLEKIHLNLPFHHDYTYRISDAKLIDQISFSGDDLLTDDDRFTGEENGEWEHYSRDHVFYIDADIWITADTLFTFDFDEKRMLKYLVSLVFKVDRRGSRFCGATGDEDRDVDLSYFPVEVVQTFEKNRRAFGLYTHDEFTFLVKVNEIKKNSNEKVCISAIGAVQVTTLEEKMKTKQLLSKMNENLSLIDVVRYEPPCQGITFCVNDFILFEIPEGVCWEPIAIHLKKVNPSYYGNPRDFYRGCYQ
jgi:hypothetical protein